MEKMRTITIPLKWSLEAFDLALTKVIGAPTRLLQVNPGDNVTFTIEVINPGMIPADNIVDYGLCPSWYDLSIQG